MSKIIQKPTEVTSLAFSLNSENFIIGTNKGFKVYSSKDHKFIKEEIIPDGVSLVQILPNSNSNTIFYIGGKDSLNNTSNTLFVYGDTKEENTNIVLGEAIVNFFVKTKYLFAIFLNQIKVFDINNGNYSDKESFKTAENERGLFALSSSNLVNIIAFPDEKQGKIKVKNFDLNSENVVEAHNSKITALTLSKDGKFLASSSEKGTVIRIFETENGNKIQEVRRGSSSATIYYLSFSPSCKYLSASSNKGTIHIFNISNFNKVENTKSWLSSIINPFSYFQSEWSFAQFRLGVENVFNIVKFTPEDQPSFMVLRMDGKYHIVNFDPEKGGEIKEFKTYNFINDKEE